MDRRTFLGSFLALPLAARAIASGTAPSATPSAAVITLGNGTQVALGDFVDQPMYDLGALNGRLPITVGGERRYIHVWDS